MASNIVEPHRHAELAPPRNGDVLVTANVGPRDDVVALWSSPAGRDALSRRAVATGGASFALDRPGHAVPVRLVRHHPQGDVVVEVDGLDLAYPSVQPLPGNRFLVVGARCRRGPAALRRNAMVFDQSGAVVDSAMFGDGIEAVATTPSGRTWVSYFDEGVLGNDGWDTPGPPPSASGLALFDADLRCSWQYPGHPEHGEILDCYALNVDGENVWAYYYTGFPVVRVTDGRVTGWSTTVRGAHHLLTNGYHCALVGEYDHPDRVTVGQLHATGRYEIRHRLRIRLPGDAELSGAELVGRGKRLHVFVGTAHHVLDLDELVWR
jgi:hypothetical protein